MSDLPRRRMHGIPRPSPEREAVVLRLPLGQDRAALRTMSEGEARRLLDGTDPLGANPTDLMLILAALREPASPQEFRGQDRAVAAYRAWNGGGVSGVRSNEVCGESRRHGRRVAPSASTARSRRPMIAIAGTAAAIAVIGGAASHSLPWQRDSATVQVSASGVIQQGDTNEPAAQLPVVTPESGVQPGQNGQSETRPPTAKVPTVRPTPTQSGSPKPTMSQAVPRQSVASPSASAQAVPSHSPTANSVTSTSGSAAPATAPSALDQAATPQPHSSEPVADESAAGESAAGGSAPSETGADPATSTPSVPPMPSHVITGKPSRSSAKPHATVEEELVALPGENSAPVAIAAPSCPPKEGPSRRSRKFLVSPSPESSVR